MPPLWAAVSLRADFEGTLCPSGEGIWMAPVAAFVPGQKHSAVWTAQVVAALGALIESLFMVAPPWHVPSSPTLFNML